MLLLECKLHYVQMIYYRSFHYTKNVIVYTCIFERTLLPLACYSGYHGIPHTSFPVKCLPCTVICNFTYNLKMKLRQVIIFETNLKLAFVELKNKLIIIKYKVNVAIS